MPWTTPATFTGGQLVGASDLNTQLRDNLLWLGGSGGVITQYVTVLMNTGVATTSNVPVAIAGAVTPTMTTASGLVLVSWQLGMSHSVPGAQMWVAVQQDSAGYTGINMAQAAGAGYVANMSGFYAVSAVPGPHTWSLGFYTSAPTLSVATIMNLSILAMELRR